MKEFEKYFKGTKKILNKRENKGSDKKIPIDKVKGICDNSRIIAVYPKTVGARNFLFSNLDSEEEIVPLPSLDYGGYGVGEVKISSQYLELISNIFGNTEKLLIKAKKDVPLWIENEDFIVLIAQIIFE